MTTQTTQNTLLTIENTPEKTAQAHTKTTDTPASCPTLLQKNDEATKPFLNEICLFSDNYRRFACHILEQASFQWPSHANEWNHFLIRAQLFAHSGVFKQILRTIYDSSSNCTGLDLCENCSDKTNHSEHASSENSAFVSQPPGVVSQLVLAEDCDHMRCMLRYLISSVFKLVDETRRIKKSSADIRLSAKI